MADWILFFWVLLAQMGLACAMFSYKLPRQEHFGWRLTACLAVLGLMACGCGVLEYATQQAFPQLTPIAAMSAPLVLLLLSFIVALHLCFVAHTSTVLFVATAAFTVQNLWSNLEAIWQTLSRELSIPTFGPTAFDLPDLLLMAAVYGLCWHFYARQITQEGLEVTHSAAMGWIVGAVLVFEVAFHLLCRTLFQEHAVSTGALLLMDVTGALGCILILAMEFSLLYRQRIEDRARHMDELLAAERRQYELSRDNLRQLHLKCHDLKHQIRTLSSGTQVDPQVLAQLEATVDIQDAMYHTGCDALDVILTEKTLAFQRQHIPFDCVADGAAIAFMDPADIYSLFGNALDNALEAQEAVNPELRAITASVKRKGQLVLINVSNPCAHGAATPASPSDTQVTTNPDGLPTTKEDRLWHGWGTRSLHDIAQRYQGTMTTQVENGVFSLRIMIPCR